jgi:tRNA pseudouridine32 synthase/23S rRNA pseudouridine746 synthase
MAALGAPILNDSLYPELHRSGDCDFSAPLQLLAASLEFVDPLSAAPRQFDSQFELISTDGARVSAEPACSDQNDG